LIGKELGLELTRGNFFHAVYRLEQKLGRVFLELRPYSLFPREYFSGWFVTAFRHLSVRIGNTCVGEVAPAAAQHRPDACQASRETSAVAPAA
jgi:hypothetical protein